MTQAHVHSVFPLRLSAYCCARENALCIKVPPSPDLATSVVAVQLAVFDNNLSQDPLNPKKGVEQLKRVISVRTGTVHCVALPCVHRWQPRKPTTDTSKRNLTRPDSSANHMSEFWVAERTGTRLTHHGGCDWPRLVNTLLGVQLARSPIRVPARCC